MRRLVRGWRPLLRIARREAVRARGRSALVLVMIALPVLAVVALDTLGRTSDVSAREGLSRQLGDADALVTFEGDRFPVDQSPDLSARAGSGTGGVELPVPTADTVAAVVGAGARVVELQRGEVTIRTPAGISRPEAVVLDLRRGVTDGLFDLEAGRLPGDTDEVAVSGRLAERGFGVGDQLPLDDGGHRKVVGVVESTTTRNLTLVVGLPGSLPMPDDGAWRSWLVERPEGVDWPTVQRLNDAGMYVLSRHVVEDPPPASEVTLHSNDVGAGSTEIAVIGLVVAMVLLEIVLLAGPAFAVGARRQQRTLALLMATGGTARDVRRAVLAAGVVLGSAAAVVGAALGVAVGWLAVPVVQQFSDTVLGPFDVSARDITVIALCGLVSALLAALAPAVVAARQDVVAVLAGRRGQTRAPLRSPVVGVLLLVAGGVLAVQGAARSAGGELMIAFASVSAVAGMVLLIPVVVVGLGGLARFLPLPVRFAVRDAARHRGRTAPAVAAVAATVAGVVALGIGGASDAAEAEATYTPSGPIGGAVVRLFPGPDARAADWDAVVAAAHRQLRDARVRVITGVPDEVVTTAEDGATTAQFLEVEPLTQDGAVLPTGYQPTYGAGTLVGAESLTLFEPDLSEADAARARSMLQAGGAVVFGYGGGSVTDVRLSRVRYGDDGPEQTAPGTTVPAVMVTAPGSVQPVSAILPEEALEGTGFTAQTVAVVVDGTAISTAEEDALTETVRGIDPNASVWVERGYSDDSTAVILLLLGSIGGVLVLGGTLTATFLALSDARPDFATMAAVGSPPGLRRRVAAAYAAFVGLVGALLGAAVGFLPGVAVTYPLTSASWVPDGATSTDGAPVPDHFLVIPWPLVVGLVIVLPLVTALVVALTSRSRLPMVSRLS